jgi:uncharacterized protein YecT (DUF1311 family)
MLGMSEITTASDAIATSKSMLRFIMQTLFIVLWSIPASALECDAAKTLIEQALCGTSELSDADAAMARTYESLRSALPGDQQALLLADQRRWLRNRDVTCGEKRDRELLECVLAETERRRLFLAGEGPNGAADAPRLQPAFFRETKKGRYEINALYPHIVKPQGPAENAFNKEAHDLVLSKKALDDTRASEPPPDAPGISSYNVTYDVTYLDPRLAAIVFTISTYGAGAAHPSTGRESLVFDFSRGRRLTLADVVSSPAVAIPAISELCKNQLTAQAAKVCWELLDDADFPAVVGEFVRWAHDKDGVNILFDQYSIAAYVFGQHECRLSWADLAPWLKPRGPLPPQEH